MRSALDQGSDDQRTERSPGSPARTLPVSQEDFNRQVCKLYVLLKGICVLNYVLFCISVCQTLLLHMALIQERQKVHTELYKVREALRDAEAKAKTQEEERNQALQKLQTSTEVGLKIYEGKAKIYC